MGLFSKKHIKELLGPDVSEKTVNAVFRVTHKMLGDLSRESLNLARFELDDIQLTFSRQAWIDLVKAMREPGGWKTPQGSMARVASQISLISFITNLLNLEVIHSLEPGVSPWLNMLTQITGFTAAAGAMFPVFARGVQNQEDSDGKILLWAVPLVILHRALGTTVSDPALVNLVQGLGSIGEVFWFAGSALNALKFEAVRDYIDQRIVETSENPELTARDLLKRFGWTKDSVPSGIEAEILPKLKNNGAKELKNLLKRAVKREQEEDLPLRVILREAKILKEVDDSVSWSFRTAG